MRLNDARVQVKEHLDAAEAALNDLTAQVSATSQSENKPMIHNTLTEFLDSIGFPVENLSEETAPNVIFESWGRIQEVEAYKVYVHPDYFRANRRRMERMLGYIQRLGQEHGFTANFVRSGGNKPAYLKLVKTKSV